jgi:hypothetical protein
VNQCREFVTQEGGDCTFDPERACANGLVPTYNQETHHFTCEKPPSPPPPSYPSHRVRVRARRKHDSRCPPSYTACPLGDSYECIDILVGISPPPSLSLSAPRLFQEGAHSLTSTPPTICRTTSNNAVAAAPTTAASTARPCAASPESVASPVGARSGRAKTGTTLFRRAGSACPSTE